MILIVLDNVDEERTNPGKYPELSHPRARIFADLNMAYLLSNPQRHPIPFMIYTAMHCGVLRHLDMVAYVLEKQRRWLRRPHTIPNWP